MRTASSGSVYDRVAEAVELTARVERHGLTPATRIVEDLRVSRFGRIKLGLYLEEIFGVEIPDEAVGRFATLGDIVRYMSRWSHETADTLARSAANEESWITA